MHGGDRSGASPVLQVRGEQPTAPGERGQWWSAPTWGCRKREGATAASRKRRQDPCHVQEPRSAHQHHGHQHAHQISSLDASGNSSAWQTEGRHLCCLVASYKSAAAAAAGGSAWLAAPNYYPWPRSCCKGPTFTALPEPQQQRVLHLSLCRQVSLRVEAPP